MVSQDGALRDLAEAGWRPQEAQDQMLLPGRPGAILRPCSLTFQNPPILPSLDDSPFLL